MRKKLFNWCYLALFVALALIPANAFASDATGFDPVPVSVKATGAGLPVGTVIAWPVAVNPPDFDKWFECDGRTVVQSTHPELYAIVGGNVPDYRGLFLRGVGGKSATIGVKQAHGVYIDPASAKIQLGGKVQSVTTGMGGGGRASHTFLAFSSSTGGTADRPDLSTTTDWLKNGSLSSQLPVKLTVSGATETRPDNMAVRYLIRAAN